MQNYVVSLLVNPFSVMDVRWCAGKSYWQDIDVHLCPHVFLGVFAKLWKATLALSYLSVHLEHLATTGQILMKFDYFSEACLEKSSLIKYDKNNRYFTQKTYVHLYLTEFFLEWEMFQTKVVEKIKIQTLYSVTFFWKLCCLWDNVEKMW
jgi:hypothetical protein